MGEVVVEIGLTSDADDDHRHLETANRLRGGIQPVGEVGTEHVGKREHEHVARIVDAICVFNVQPIGDDLVVGATTET